MQSLKWREPSPKYKVPREPVRWEVGEAIVAKNPMVPGLFVFMYAAVIGWKLLVSAIPRRQEPLLALPPPRGSDLAPEWLQPPEEPL